MSHSEDQMEQQNSGGIEFVLQQVLEQLKQQKSELNHLREEVKDSKVSVKSEVTMLLEKELTWKREGNKQQYNFNCDIDQDCVQALWAITNNKFDYATNLLKDCSEKIKKRNKLIRIADTSEAGWDTVKLYETNPVASDSEGEFRINKAENRALKKRKQAVTRREASKKRSQIPSAGPLIYPGQFSSSQLWMSPTFGTGDSHNFPGPSGNFRAFGGRKGPSGNCVNDNFTTNYFEYESGRKQIIVKGRLRDNLKLWKDIGSSNFIIDIIENGYRLPFYSKPQSAQLDNNLSAKKEPIFVEEAISNLLDRGLVEKCIEPPYIVNPLTVSIQAKGKKRLILDLRIVNQHMETIHKV
ncbi:uncharacterized protein [Palaemon carinicauda]|uniref:uncharacterized protein n=1 Tax=Palaemon carinicauda TaxID=392227 RepID=UPI0035B5EC9D